MSTPAADTALTPGVIATTGSVVVAMITTTVYEGPGIDDPADADAAALPEEVIA